MPTIRSFRILCFLWGVLFHVADEALGFSTSLSLPTTTSSERSTTSSALFQSPNKIYSPGNNNDADITPNQIKTLRKEAAKRIARKTMAQQSYYVGGEESEESSSGEGAQDFFSTVCALLEENELVQIRGVSKNQKRKVYETADQLAEDLSLKMKRSVFVVEIKGFAVTLYCGSLDENKKGRILLRSSYQEGAWELRMKAPRDHRGQIIRD